MTDEITGWAADSLRWFGQRMPGLILIIGLALFLLGPLYFPTFYWIIVMIVCVCLVSNAVRMTVGLVITSIKVKKHIEIDWMLKYKQIVTQWPQGQVPAVVPSQIKHIIVIPNYKEEFETLCETLDTLANHYQAKTTYKVVLAMEQGEQGCDAKADKLINMFGQHFFSMKYTVHPSGIPGEARGKSSNVAWAVSYYHKTWMQAGDSAQEIVTVMDADTHLTSKYFDCISCKYCIATEEEHTRMLFAPCLVFDRNANDVPFVVRLADICWSIGLMSNFQLTVKFPCSVYTLSMLLAERVGFWDAGPEAIGEDMHMALKCWTMTGMQLISTPIYIPASCSCVQADTYLGSVNARYQQSIRHLWGALDFGYTFSNVFIRGCWHKAPLRSAMCVYLLFEIFYQPYFGFYQFAGQYIFPQSLQNPVGIAVIQYTTYIRLALIPPAVIVAFVYERYHYLACHYRATVLLAVKRKNEAAKLVDQAESGAASNSATMDLESVDSEFAQSNVAFRRYWQVLDWTGLPVCLVFYYILPGVNAMLRQMISNKLDYKVSLKPTTRAPVNASAAASPIQGEASVSQNSSTGTVCRDEVKRGHMARDSGVEIVVIAN